MNVMWGEVVRELRWFATSRALVLVLISCVALAVCGAMAGATSTDAAIAAFHATLARYQANGEDIARALRTPSVVSGNAADQVIQNPLRHDLDQAVLALTQLQPAGAISATLSLCALIAFPILGFVLGIFVATHDVKSGSIIARWPACRLAAFSASKTITLALVMLAMTVTTGAIAIPASRVTGTFVNGIGDLDAFAIDPPGLGRIALIAGLATLSGIAGATFGQAVGAATRNRTFTVAVFSIAYLLLPLLGASDPRNVLAEAGVKILYFPGTFHPLPVPGLAHDSAGWGLLAIAAGCSLAAALPWKLRSRAARVS